MAEKFTAFASNALKYALFTARELGHTYIGSEHILLGLLSEKDGVAARLLGERGVTEDSTRELVCELAGTGDRSEVTADDMTPALRRIIKLSSYKASKTGQSRIGTEHILFALLEEPDCVGAKLLTSQNILLSDVISDIISFFESEDGIRIKPDSPHTVQKSKKTEEIHPASPGKGLNGMPNLRQYGRDLCALASSGKLDPIIGRERETMRLIQILSRRTKNNPCLTGEPGVGKTAVVEGLARRIADGDVPETLAGKLIVSLDITAMIAGAKYRGEFEERMKGVMNEAAKNPNIILFIDELHTVLGAAWRAAAGDAANILKPALARGELIIIGATTPEEYRRHIERDAALERRFLPVPVGEPTPEQAKSILFGLREKYEEYHKVKISDEAICAALELSIRYINDRYLPDKAIDLIDEAASGTRIRESALPDELRAEGENLKKLTEEKERAILEQDFELAAELRDKESRALAEYEKAKSKRDAENKKEVTVNAEDIADVVTLWTGIPVKKLAAEEGKNLLKLEEQLHERIIGQDEAVSAIARAIRRGRSGLKDPARPIGSFVFTGPTGVGKTELSKALAEVLFGDKKALIRLDMSEYMEKHSVSRLIGSPPGYVGYDDSTQLTDRVRAMPYSVVLFDEIEKAHPDVYNLLLQILEEGALTDSKGRRADFRNTVIIMTSNIGSDKTGSGMSAGFSTSDPVKHSDISAKAAADRLKELFRPELINRIDEIIVFRALTEREIREIAEKMLAQMKERVLKLGIEVEFDESAVMLLAGEGMDPKFGARPLRRYIQRTFEDVLSEKLLDGSLKAGMRVTVRAENGKLIYDNEPSG